jgi:hypothetical protein
MAMTITIAQKQTLVSANHHQMEHNLNSVPRLYNKCILRRRAVRYSDKMLSLQTVQISLFERKKSAALWI